MIVYDTQIPDFIRRILKENRYSRVYVLADSNTFPIFKQLNISGIPESHIHVIPAGEQHKTLSTAAEVWEFLARHQADRKSLMIHFGGGMVTDLGGFVASTYMRGIRFIHIPSTLLAMVDAAVGSKTGINLMHYKNYVGTFAPAEAVLIDTQILEHLPEDELVNGWAEVIKHGVIAGGTLWSICKESPPPVNDKSAWSHIVKLNIEIKQEIVERDPVESGLRRILNFGHSIGHAIETAAMMQKDYIGHGHAVAAGMIVESLIARDSGILSSGDCEEIIRAVDAKFQRATVVQTWQPLIETCITGDKKNESGHILMSLPAAIGDVRPGIEISPNAVRQGLLHYAQA